MELHHYTWIVHPFLTVKENNVENCLVISIDERQNHRMFGHSFLQCEENTIWKIPFRTTQVEIIKVLYWSEDRIDDAKIVIQLRIRVLIRRIRNRGGKVKIEWDCGHDLNAHNEFASEIMQNAV